MKCKKNVLSYILWALYFILVSVALSATGLKLVEWAGITQGRFMVLLVCLFFVTVAVSFGILRHIFLYLQREAKEADSLFFVWMERVVVLFLIIVLAAMRIIYVNRYAHILAGNSLFYDLAKVTEQSAVPWIAHNASYVYVRVLSLLFLFAGNHPGAAVCLQAVLQMAVIALFYFIVRRLLGKAAGVFYLLSAACLPQYILNLNVLSPEMIVCLAAGIGLYASVRILDDMKAAKKCGWKYIAAFFGAGLLLAVNGYLDIFGMVIFLAAAAGIFLLDCRALLSERLLCLAGLICGFMAGLTALFSIESLYARVSFFQAVKTYLSLYASGILLSVPGPGNGAVLWGSAVLCFLAGLGVAGYFKQGWEKSGIVSVLLLGGTLLACFHVNQIDYPVLNGLLWTLAACVGVQYFADLYFDRRTAEQMAEQTKLPEQGSENGEPEETEPETMKPFPLLPWEKEVPGEAGGDKSPEESGESSLPQEVLHKQEIHYIKNPLPLPKKHVKREFDYGFEPEEDQMQFDLEDEKIKENDGFDIE